MRRTASVLFIILSAGIFWHCAGPQGRPVSQEMKGKLSFLPEQSGGLAYVNISKVLNSEFLQTEHTEKWENRLEDEEYLEFATETGFDIKKDVHEVFVLLSNDEERSEPNILAVVYGEYDPDKIMDYIDKKERGREITESEYRKFQIYEIDEYHNSFCFVENTVLLYGSADGLKKWLDNYTDKKQNSSWIKKANKVKYKTDAYFVMDAREFIDEAIETLSTDRNADKISPLKKIHSLSGSAKINSGLHFDGCGRFSDAEHAELFHDAFKGLVSGAKLTMSDDRDVIDIINKLDVDLDGRVVHISFSINKEDIEKLASKQKLIAVR